MNIFGHNFRVNIFGASHAEFVGAIVDGCPAGLELSEEDFTNDLARRNCNYTGRSSRIEEDTPEIISGIFNSFTTGEPIAILFKNKNIRSKDYNKFFPRPNHGDFVTHKKYSGFNDYRGGGATSGRMTVGIVAAGVIAKKLFPEIKFNCNVVSLHNSTNLKEELALALSYKDSIGGVLRCSILNVPIGLGEPFFNSIESCLSHIIFSIPGVKAIEFGTGWSLTNHYGSEVNDSLISSDGTTRTNYSGGINAGISNGNEIYFSVAVRPTPSIFVEQDTINIQTGKQTKINISGRHDVCFAMRVPVIIEAAAAIVLADFLFEKQSTLNKKPD